jgi:hypothetical protein
LTAVACLRIVVDLQGAKRDEQEALEPLVGKVTRAFLESRWSWPKRFEPMGEIVFMLSDPRVTRLDGAELRRLAEELQFKLFGSSATGEVALLLFEGGEEAVAGFVAMPASNLMRAVRHDEEIGLIGGSLQKITSAGVTVVSEPAAAAPRPAATAAASAAPKPLTVEVEAHFRGIYFCARQAFIGSIIAPSPADAFVAYSLVDGVDRLPVETAPTFDADCVTAAAKVLEGGGVEGMLVLPVSFSAMARRSTRQAYAEALQRLADYPKSQLGALVYDAPRAPSFTALGQLLQVLDTRFGMIDLATTDPHFEVDSLPNGAVHAVSLILPEAPDRVRHAAARRFLSQREAFRRRQISPAVSNVRSRVDLAVCVKGRAAYVTGAAVCGPQPVPLAPQPWAAVQLPYQPPGAGRAGRVGWRSNDDGGRMSAPDR